MCSKLEVNSITAIFDISSTPILINIKNKFSGYFFTENTPCPLRKSHQIWDFYGVYFVMDHWKIVKNLALRWFSFLEESSKFDCNEKQDVYKLIYPSLTETLVVWDINFDRLFSLSDQTEIPQTSRTHPDLASKNKKIWYQTTDSSITGGFFDRVLVRFAAARSKADSGFGPRPLAARDWAIGPLCPLAKRPRTDFALRSRNALSIQKVKSVFANTHRNRRLRLWARAVSHNKILASSLKGQKSKNTGMTYSKPIFREQCL